MIPEKPDENSQKKLKKLRDAKPEDNQHVAVQVSAHKDSSPFSSALRRVALMPSLKDWAGSLASASSRPWRKSEPQIVRVRKVALKGAASVCPRPFPARQIPRQRRHTQRSF